MNQDQLGKFRNDVLRHCIKSLSCKRNVININTGNTVHHEQTKFRICYELQKQGIHYVTEARMGNKGVADILVLDKAQIIEILASETEDEVKNKVKKYPSEIEIVSVRGWEEYMTDNYTVVKQKLI